MPSHTPGGAKMRGECVIVAGFNSVEVFGLLAWATGMKFVQVREGLRDYVATEIVLLTTGLLGTPD